MLNWIYKVTLKRKNARRFIREFFRARYESVNEDKLDIMMVFVHRLLMSLYRNFNPKKKIFDVISIQTQTGCNYNCPFCPSNKPPLNLYGGTVETTKMDFTLFKNIVEQLSNLKFRGRISVDLLNEPLMDRRLSEFISIIRKKCPKAFLFIQSNGSLLDKKLAMELIKSGIDEIYVNDYTEGHTVLNRLANISLDKKYRVHITTEERSFTERLSNRAGNVSIYAVPKESLRIPCVKPFRQISIAYDGQVILCCQDWQFTQVMGDATKETLLDIWSNRIYKKVRHDLRNFNRASNALCAKCDFSGLW